jgi:hypothetical protein
LSWGKRSLITLVTLFFATKTPSHEETQKSQKDTEILSYGPMLPRDYPFWDVGFWGHLLGFSRVFRVQLAYTLWNRVKRAIAVFDRRLTFHSRLFWFFLQNTRTSEKNTIQKA